MKGEAVGRLGKPGQQAIGQHRLGAADRLLRRLGDEDQGAAPAVLQRDQRLGRADPGRHVDVVPAAVGDEGRLAAILALLVRGVGQAGLFLHRQGVELGAHHDHRSGAVAIDGDDTGAADMLGHVEPIGAHLPGQHGGRSGLVEAELRVGVDVLVKRVQVRIARVQGAVDGGLLNRHVHGRDRPRREYGEGR